MKYLTAMLLFLLVLANQGCRKTENVSAVRDAPVYESPRLALLSFFEGIRDCDRSKAISAVIDSTVISRYVNAFIATVQSMNNFAKADREFFGDGGFSADFAQRIVDDVDKTEIEMISDTSAQWPQNPEAPHMLSKTKQGWRIDPNKEDFKDFLLFGTRVFRDNETMYNALTAGIRNGEIKTRDESRDEMARLKERFKL